MPSLLEQWQRSRLPRLRELASPKPGSDAVTIVAYHFWEQEDYERRFDLLECAIRETWFRCGLLRTVLVVNRLAPRVERFAAEFDGWVTLQVEPALLPGQIHSMSVDCNLNLHRRFDTEHVLIVQGDGFPLRPGLEAFVGRWDFIGAPYVRNTLPRRLLCNALNCWVSNGGFSLRSKRICELASHYWASKFHDAPACRAVSEDIFYTETLPLHVRKYRRAVKIADAASAITFAYDAVFPFPGSTCPFGFHGDAAFQWLHQKGWVEPLPTDRP